MAGKFSRDKGARFERQIVKVLDEVTHEKWRRTPLSGGWAKEAVQGDLVCVTKSCSLVFELKNQESWSFDAFMNGKYTILDHWWEQAVKVSGKPGSSVVIFTKNHHGCFALFDTDLYNTINGKDPAICLHLGNRVVWPLTDFVNSLDWKKVLGS